MLILDWTLGARFAFQVVSQIASGARICLVVVSCDWFLVNPIGYSCALFESSWSEYVRFERS